MSLLEMGSAGAGGHSSALWFLCRLQLVLAATQDWG